MKRTRGGFTLVELIVVIAILGILAGAAIPIYSNYVSRANKAADEAMIAEIEHALAVGGYDLYPATGSVGTVTLKQGEPATSNSEEISAILEKTYGSGWAEQLKLKTENYYGGGSVTNKLANLISSTQDTYAWSKVPESTFMTKSNPQALMGQVDDLVDAFTKVMDQHTGQLMSFWGDSFRNYLGDEGITYNSAGDEKKLTSNLTVFAAANSIVDASNAQKQEWINNWVAGTNSNMTGSAYVAPAVMNFVRLNALAKYIDKPAVTNAYKDMVEKLSQITNENGGYVQQFTNVMKEFTEYVEGRYASKVNEYNNSEQAKTDAEAFIATMAALNSIKTDAVTKENVPVLKGDRFFSEKSGAADLLDQVAAYAADPASIPTEDGCSISLLINGEHTPVVTSPLTDVN